MCLLLFTRNFSTDSLVSRIFVEFQKARFSKSELCASAQATYSEVSCISMCISLQCLCEFARSTT